MTNKETLLDELSSLVDGEASALERHADLLASSDELRDLRHDATEVAARLADSGADYQVPDDMEQRIQNALFLREEATAKKTVSDDSPTAEAPKAEPETRVQTSDGKAFAFGAFGAFAAAAAILVAVVGAYGIKLFVDSNQTTVAKNNSDALTATVGTVATGSKSPLAGISITDADGDNVEFEKKMSIPNGATISTDDKTRIQLSLSDGSELVLNQGTTVQLAEQTRTVHLTQGQLVADVAHLDKGPRAFYTTSLGDVEVLGTKFVLTADKERASVRMMHGTVNIKSKGRSIAVSTGQEGVMSASEAPEIMPATNLARETSWSELGDRDGDDDLPIAGLGELRAKKPGEKEESERPMSLSHHKVTVRVVGNVARTEIEETFQNDSKDVLEGIYRFPLPQDARIARLSLDVDGKWEEGSFVSKDRAKKIWRGVIRNATPEQKRVKREEFIWVPGPWRDPALLEWQAGGRFELRIFPIPANGSRRIKIAYEQTIAPHAGHRRYVYPLAHAKDGSTSVGHFEIDAKIAGSQAKAIGYKLVRNDEANATRLRFSQDNFKPQGDLVIDYASPGDKRDLQWWTFEGDATTAPPENSREGNDAVSTAHANINADKRPYVAFALKPQLPLGSEVKARDYVFVLDSSQSMVGERFKRASRLAAHMVTEMDRRDRFTAFTCDLECKRLNTEGDDGFAAPSSRSSEMLKVLLKQVSPAGSSNMVAALKKASALTRQGRELHVVYIGDGISTVGHRRASSIGRQVADFSKQASITTVGIGQDADAQTLAFVALEGGGQYIPFVPGQRTSSAAFAVLEATYGSALRNAKLELPNGISDVSPAKLPTLRSGQEVIVVGRLNPGAKVQGDVKLTGNIDGTPFNAKYSVKLDISKSAGNAFVPRLWASKTIEAVELTGSSKDNARVTALSKAYGVLSKQTSLLVLESDAMFKAFKVDRAKPSIQWTGDEDSVVGAADATASAEMLGAVAAKPIAAPSKSMDDMLSGALGTRGRSASGGAPAEKKAAADQLEALGYVTTRRQTRPRARRKRRMMRRPPSMTNRFGGGGGYWRPVRRVRVLSASNKTQIRSIDEEAVRRAQTALSENPDSRDRQRSLVRALSRAGQLVKAEESAREWMKRDRLDPEALTYLSDIIGRQGRRQEALRVLSGIVDLAPENIALRKRLANAFDRAGESSASCEHRTALAETDLTAPVEVGAALRCNRSLGRALSASTLLDLVPNNPADESCKRRRGRSAASCQSLRARVETQAAVVPKKSSRSAVKLSGTWEGSDDLDLSIITPQGTRISWMGGRTSVMGSEAFSLGREELGLKKASNGTYYIEVSRTTKSTTPITGTIKVRTTSDGRSDTTPLRFTLSGNRAVVGQFKSSIVRR